jgi:hypothetical protein
MKKLKDIYENIQDRSSLIKALKNNDYKQAEKAVSGKNPQNFGLTDKDFKEILGAIKSNNLTKARKIFSVEKEYIPTSNLNTLNKYEIEELINFIDKFSGAKYERSSEWQEAANVLERYYLLKNKDVDIRQFKSSWADEFQSIFSILDSYYDNNTQTPAERQRIEKIYDKVFEQSGQTGSGTEKIK